MNAPQDLVIRVSRKMRMKARTEIEKSRGEREKSRNGLVGSKYSATASTVRRYFTGTTRSSLATVVSIWRSLPGSSIGPSYTQSELPGLGVWTLIFIVNFLCLWFRLALYGFTSLKILFFIKTLFSPLPLFSCFSCCLFKGNYT